MDPMICARSAQLSTSSLYLNKLQAHKSSFQAWKSVSLVFALIVLVLIGSKRHEVGSDLQQLEAVARLILTRANNSQDQNETPDQNPSESYRDVVAGSGSTMSLGSLLDALESALPNNASEPLDASQMIPVPSLSSSSSSSSSSSLHPNGSSTLVSHKHASTGAQELLRFEVHAFAGEFCGEGSIKVARNKL